MVEYNKFILGGVGMEVLIFADEEVINLSFCGDNDYDYDPDTGCIND